MERGMPMPRNQRLGNHPVHLAIFIELSWL